MKPASRQTFLDPQFLLMRRWSNDTELVANQLDDEVDLCYFRGANAALYICEDVVSYSLRF